MTDTQNSAGVPITPEKIEELKELLETFDEAAQEWGYIGCCYDYAGVSVDDPVAVYKAAKLIFLARITELKDHVAAHVAAMPTIWGDPAGKGYPCFERPMTPAEAKREIERLQAHIAAEPDRMRAVVERCAKLAEDEAREVDLPRSVTAEYIAAAIRAQEQGQ